VPSAGQTDFMTRKIEELAWKAKMKGVPELCISKSERLANVNVFQRRISIGEHLLSLWGEGKFDDADIEATLAHEVGHLMDFRRDSSSASFQNLLLESLWFSFGVVPLVVYLLSPSMLVLMFSATVALVWGFSIPWIVRRVEVGVELEADKKAARYLVSPQQLANALKKINSLGLPGNKFGFTAKLSFWAGTLTHPSFKERLRNLQNL